jgi:hypothetical protein
LNAQHGNTYSTGRQKWIAWFGIIFLVNFSFLFSPQPRSVVFSDDICIESYVHLNRYMGFPVNCDAISFISAAIKPAILFQKGYIRQSRPAYILTGTITGYFLYYISYPLHPFIAKKLQGHLSTDDSGKNPQTLVVYACFYLAFVLINTIILTITFWLFEKITFGFFKARPHAHAIFPLMLVLLVSTPVCKAFFWTVHQQLFNVLMPVLALYIGLRLIRRPNKLSALLLIAFLSGFLALFYANSILLLPAICFSYLMEVKGRKRRIPAKEWCWLAAITLAFFFASLLWILLLRINGVPIYNNEITVAREFVWITDILNTQGRPFWKEFADNTKAFIQTFSITAFPALALLIVLVSKKKEALNIFRQVSSNPPLQSQMTVIAFIAIQFLLFYWLMGFYATRLTTALNPFIIYATALLLIKQAPDRKFTILLFLIIICMHLYTVFSYGPFS